MSANHRSCVRLVNAQFYAWHGVHEEERRLGGDYEVDLELRFDFREAASCDDLSKTVDYSRAYGIVREEMTGRNAALIETLAYAIATTLMEEFPLLAGVTATIRKLRLPLGGPCGHAEAEHRIDRD
jgi:dihydroneopterin aldolase